MKRRATAFVTVLALALLAPGCGRGDDGDGYPEGTLEEYRPGYDRVRSALARAAPRLPRAVPGGDVCRRTVQPLVSLADPDTEPGRDDGNAELMMEGDLTSPGVPESRDAPTSFDRFTVLPGSLARGLRVTGPRGPLGGNAFRVGPDHDADAHPHDEDPGERLGRSLDAGLRVRYVVALRVTGYTPPEVRAVPESVGSGSYAVGEVTVDAFVIDLEQGDVPCRFRGHGESPQSVFWTEGTAEQQIYDEIRRSLSLDVHSTLHDGGAGVP